MTKRDFKTIDLNNGDSPASFLAVLQNGGVAAASAGMFSAGDNSIKIWANPIKNNNPVTLEGHKSSVSCLVSIKSDNLLVSASFDATIKIWSLKNDANNRHSVKTLRDDDNASGPIFSVVDLHDGKIASGSADKAVRIWDIKEQKPLPLILSKKHASAVLSLALLRPGFLASGGASNDNSINLWDINQKEHVRTLGKHEGSVHSLAFMPDGDLAVGHDFTPGDRLASGSADKSVKIWNLNKKECQFKLSGHSGPVLSLTFFKDHFLASGSGDKTIQLWKIDKDQSTDRNKSELTLKGHGGSVLSLSEFSDDYLVSSGSDKLIKFWNKNSWKLKLESSEIDQKKIPSSVQQQSSCVQGTKGFL